jgi:hypothetical protein
MSQAWRSDRRDKFSPTDAVVAPAPPTEATERGCPFRPPLGFTAHQSSGSHCGDDGDDIPYSMIQGLLLENCTKNQMNAPKQPNFHFPILPSNPPHSSCHPGLSLLSRAHLTYPALGTSIGTA